MNIAEIDLLTLPSLPLAERRNLPNCPAIYFVIDGDQVLYIGKTVNLMQRWISHHPGNNYLTKATPQGLLGLDLMRLKSACKKKSKQY